MEEKKKKRRRRFHLTDEKFTLKDFRGVLILLTGLLSVQLLIYFTRVYPEGEAKGLSVSMDTVQSRSPGPGYRTGTRKKDERKQKVEPHPFDPNTVDSATLVSFGFSPKQTASILKYRAAGGKFYRPEDFSKLYVVNDYMYRKLRPYIRIAGGNGTRKKECPVLDLNAADSAALDALPGIGGYYARKILEYRDRLGWFVDKEQLLEVYRFGDERFERLKDRVTVGTVEKVYLSDCDSVFIVEHPYLGRGAYREIREYNDFNPGRKPGIREYLENKVIRTLNGKYLILQFR